MTGEWRGNPPSGAGARTTRPTGAPLDEPDWAALLATDPRQGAAAVLEILSLPPRYKPSRGLLIDPGDDAHRRWERKVEATRALLADPTAAALVEHELADELADCPELAAEVRADPRHPEAP